MTTNHRLINSLASLITILAIFRFFFSIPIEFMLGCATFSLLIILADLLNLFVTARINPKNNIRLQKNIQIVAKELRDLFIFMSFPASFIVPYVLHTDKNVMSMFSDAITLLALGFTLLLISIRE